MHHVLLSAQNHRRIQYWWRLASDPPTKNSSLAPGVHHNFQYARPTSAKNHAHEQSTTLFTRYWLVLLPAAKSFIEVDKFWSHLQIHLRETVFVRQYIGAPSKCLTRWQIKRRRQLHRLVWRRWLSGQASRSTENTQTPLSKGCTTLA